VVAAAVGAQLDDRPALFSGAYTEHDVIAAVTGGKPASSATSSALVRQEARSRLRRGLPVHVAHDR
jgi:hypothetical protein